MGNIINRKCCAGKCGGHIYYRKNPFNLGWGKGGVSHGVKGVKGWGRKLPHGVKGVKNSGGGVKIIGWGKTPCKSYPTLLVSIVCIDRATRRVS